MKWRGRRQSRNIEDRRTSRSGGRARKAGGAGGMGLIAILLIGWFLGVDVTSLLNDPSLTGGASIQSSGGPLTEEDKRAGEFVSVTLADTEEVWDAIFADQVGEFYTPVTLVLFKGATQSPCGGANGATGPFYCPADKKAYLDTAFFTTLSNRLGAKGDFAAAYVIAHEIAHHVQNELGTLGQANAMRQRASSEDSNAISVRIELQADCYSGIWARHAQQRFGSLERGDIAEAMNAAKQIGDDKLQASAGRRPMPHTYTHGTSAQRQRWFETGYKSGDMRDCDTFSANRL